MATLQYWEQESVREAEIGKDGKFTTKWSVIGTTDEGIALAIVYSNASKNWKNYFFLEAMSATALGPDTWEVTLTYGKEGAPEDKSQNSDNPNDGTWKLSWDMTGGTAHVTQSQQQMGSGGDRAFWGADSHPNFQGAIGVSEQGVAGCDIHDPEFQWHETRQIPRAIACSFGYIRTLRSLAKPAHTNAAPFRGCAAGEVLFLGAKGDISSKDPRFMEVTFNFAASENKAGIVIGNCDPVDKGGWEYLWVLYHETQDTAAKYKIRKPVAVYVERVYDPGDFDTLLIGS
jgi:hypothetical protein